jgi:hypothetical protein
LIVGETFDMDRVVERLENRRDLVDDVERDVAGHGVAAAEQQAGIEFDLDPQLVAAHGHLVGADQVAERRTDVVGDAFQRVAGASDTGIDLIAVLDQRLGRGHGLGPFLADRDRLQGAIGVGEDTDQRLEMTLYLPSLIEEIEYITTKTRTAR